MARRRLLVSLGLVLFAAVMLAGCLQDIERRHVDASWEPEVTVHEAPSAQVRGAPAMVVAEGSVDLPADANLTLTGLSGELTRTNASIELEPMVVHSEAGTQRAADAEGQLSVADGEALTVTFVPADDAPRRAPSDRAWNVSLEAQWRFRDDASFDAGRLTVERNLTPEPLPGLGVGVAEREDAEVHRLVFEAIDVDELPGQLEVEAVEIGGGSAEAIDTVAADVSLSEGTARLDLAENVTVPEGSGYLVFRLVDVDGIATTGLRASEDPVPAPSALATAATLAAISLAAARRDEP